MNILFVCTGNTCRSPMAQAILQRKTNHHVQSAGIFAGQGSPASEGASQVLRQQGISYDHQSQPVTKELMEWADLVLTMTQQHRDMLKQNYSEYGTKVFTLKEYTASDYEQVWTALKEAYAQLEEAKLTDSDEKERLSHKIKQLEDIVQKVDVSDPFGGNHMTYQKTYEELDKYLALLIKKLENIDKRDFL
ncbi:low molecular weight protein tyrosine phosphatase [Gracilibacillus boraciitolerans JCM 21714]|uniref:Low molecular weight protein tyrosine phosphatase n=2 Tax=Gracilibacillus boraciitolerans TaxID=307521 RepID=W4VH94_9BACI|nr:low molecular weight protein tyrosine phosphatase [Gracilibacillus boraciitolerans JCM 21714]